MFYCNYTPNSHSKLREYIGRLVRVGETFNRFADFGLWIAQNACGGPAKGAIALPQSL